MCIAPLLQSYSMEKIRYRYSLKWDLTWAYRTIKNYRWCRSKGLPIFTPSVLKMIELWICRPVGPKIETEFPVTCYWISSGTWGAYTPPDKVFICPRNQKNIERVIKHEITHLKYNDDVKNMTHEEKEKFINSKMAPKE